MNISLILAEKSIRVHFETLCFKQFWFILKYFWSLEIHHICEAIAWKLNIGSIVISKPRQI